MANNTLFSSASQDVVGIFDMTSSAQLFVNARTIKAKINEAAQVMSHPVEDGTTVTDHIVILPISIELSVIVSSSDYRSVYESIKASFKKGTLLTVQTKSGTYRSMIIAAMPHDEDPELFNALSIAVKLQEVKFAKFVQGGAVKKVSNPKNPKHSSSVNGGKQQPKTDPNASKKSSILYGWLH